MAANSKIEKYFNFFLFFTQKQRKKRKTRFQDKLVKYSNFYDIFAGVWPILMKFHVAKHIRLPELKSDQKFENFKIQVNI